MRLESLDILSNVDSNDDDGNNNTAKCLQKNDTTLTLIDSKIVSLSPHESLSATNSNSLSNDFEMIKYENKKNNKHVIEFKHKEGGWGWIVLLCVIWSYGLAVSWYTNFNLIIPHFINYYNQTEHYTVFYSGMFEIINIVFHLLKLIFFFK